MKLDIAVLSQKGGREVNEDACSFFSKNEIYCCVLSDGLGGHYGGEVASRLVVQTALEEFNEAPVCSLQATQDLLYACNETILEEQKHNKKLRNMCATAVLLTIDSKRNIATWGHIGDSRLYCIRRGQVVIQTRDHSVTQSMVDAGHLKPEEIRNSPNRSQLLSALGNDDNLEMDIAKEVFSVNDGDIFLLCSDGLWEYVEENLMIHLLNISLSPSEWLRNIEMEVIARGHEKQDNYSGIAIRCDDPDAITRALNS